MTAQGGQQENANSVHEECHVSNRHMTWWHNAWWIRVDNGPHMRSARGRRRTWRAARQTAEQVSNGNRVEATWREEKERLKKGRKVGRKAAQTEQRGHPTPNPTRLTTATPAAPATTTPAAPATPATTATLATAAAASSRPARRCILCLLLDRGLLAHLPNFVEWLAALENS